MNKRDFERLAKSLTSYLPLFTYNKTRKLIFLEPVLNMFRGMVLDSSAFSSTVFHPTIFVQPLYVPAETFVLTFGRRLLGSWQFNPEEEASLVTSRLIDEMRKQGCFKLIEDLSTPEKFAENIGDYVSPHPYVQQAVGYSLAVSGRERAAIECLDQCSAMLRKMNDEQPSLKWPSAILDEVATLRGALVNGPEAARELLDEWTSRTKARLGLPA